MLYIPLIVLITILHAYLDAQKIKKHEYIDHSWRSTIYFFSCLLCTILIEYTSTIPNWYPFACLGLIVTTRVSIFDYALNIFRNKPLSYTSLTTSSTIDQFYNKYKININIIRITSWIITIISYIYLYSNNIY